MVCVEHVCPSRRAGVAEARRREALDYVNRVLPRRAIIFLLSDFLDSPSETAPSDDAIVAAAVDGIRALNAAYGGGGADILVAGAHETATAGATARRSELA